MFHFYDFEVFEKLWTVTIISPNHKTDVAIVNDKEKLEEYYEKYKNEIFIGYNSRHYDQWIFKSILCGFKPKEMSDWIIKKDEYGNNRNPRKFSNILDKYPLNNYDCRHSMYGLKKLEGFMGNDIRETTIPFDYKGEFTPAMITEVLKYNRHDVLQTIEVFKGTIAEFNAQVALLHTFGLPRSMVGLTQPVLASIILNAHPVRYDDEWDIRIPDTLQLTKYKHVADWCLNEMGPENSVQTFNICGIDHVVAEGGLHAAELQFFYRCKEDEVLVMADVTALYPFIMKVYGLHSRAIPDPQRLYDILDTSVALKDEAERLEGKEKEAKKKERGPYKLICNKTYGAMGDKYNWLYDPRNRLLVCVFGQLLIIDLLEKVEPFIKLIQSNTDGILVKLKRSDLERFKEEVHKWEKRVGLTMTFDEFIYIAQKDVNNYVAVKSNGKYKAKGGYVKPLNDLDNDLPIVNRAVREYILNGTHPRTTVMASNDLVDFQKLVSVSDKFLYAVKLENVPCKIRLNPSDQHEEYEPLAPLSPASKLTDKTFRVFASRRKSDGIIGRVKEEGGTVHKFANTPDKCFIWNESVKGIAIPPQLDREWYVEMAIKRLGHFGVKL